MKLYFKMIVALAVMFSACQGGEKQDANKTVTRETLKNDDDKYSYAMGVDIGKSIKLDEIKFNKDAFLKGMDDFLTGAKTVFTDDELRKIKIDKRMARIEARRKKSDKVGNKNKEEGEKFLAENKTKEGVVTLESGLQYKILTEGKGQKPLATDTVSVHYKGALINGKEFDSSYKRGEPAKFPVNRVVRGWTEALQLMPMGSKWQLFIPPELGYGPRGAGEDIGPNSVLIFEIELLNIEKPTEPVKE